MGKKVQSYTAEFRAEAVKLVLGSGILLAGALQRISVPQGTWLTECQSPWSEACRYPWSVAAELEGENKQPRRELAQMRMERDFVKKKPLRTLLCQGIAARCVLMKAWRSQYPITVMAKVHGTLAVQQPCQRDTMENGINLMKITGWNKCARTRPIRNNITL